MSETVEANDVRKSAAEAFANDSELLGALNAMEITSSRSDAAPKAAAKSPSAGFAKLKASVQLQAITKAGFGASRHVYEQEGSDAVLFREVPDWISFTGISGCRYRRVTGIRESDDELEHFRDNVIFFGYPGASGWADKIGDVAVHYMHAKWCVFSKVYPFDEQADSLNAHEDALLLGSCEHVMLTPQCAHSIGPAGLANGKEMVKLLDSEGSLLAKPCTVDALPSGVRHRLYLTWGHEASAFAGAVKPYERPLQELLDEKETKKSRVCRLFSSLQGQTKVPEQWMRYPGAPLDPSYYTSLLSKATGMTEEEEEARAFIEPQMSARGGGASATGAAPSAPKVLAALAAPAASATSTASVAIDIADAAPASDVTA